MGGGGGEKQGGPGTGRAQCGQRVWGSDRGQDDIGDVAGTGNGTGVLIRVGVGVRRAERGLGGAAAASSAAREDMGGGITRICRPARRSTTLLPASGSARVAARCTLRSGRRVASRSTGRSS
jgi:hypothetical protein